MKRADRCSVDACGKPTYCRGLCCAHYKRQQKRRPPSAIRQRPTAADTRTPVHPPTFTSVTELLAELAAGIPALRGARCVGSHELFDAAITAERNGRPEEAREARDYARRAALELCAQCPALDPCRAWLDSLPAPQRPPGVIAGRVHTGI